MEALDVRLKSVSWADTLKLVKKLKYVYGVVGKKTVFYDLKKDRPSDDDLKKILIGRSGTMRAPCLQVDDLFIGGFDADLYKKVLKIK